jgi:hypothetical protein
MAAFKNRSAEAALLSQLLAKARMGDIITYASMSDHISADIRTRRHVLTTALNIVRNDHDMVFGCIQNVGIQRLNDREIVLDGKRDLQKIQRTAKRATIKQSKVDFDALTNQDKLKFTAQRGILGALNVLSKPRSLTRLEGTITEAEKAIPLEKTLALFMKPQDEAGHP